MEQLDEEMNDENIEDEIYVIEFLIRSGRKRKFISKMKEFKFIVKFKDNFILDLGFDKIRDRYYCVFCLYIINVLFYYQRYSQFYKCEKSIKKYICDNCEFICEKVKDLFIYKKEYLYEKYYCDFCEYNGEIKEDFENYMKKYEDLLLYFCKYCDQRFRIKI